MSVVAIPVSMNCPLCGSTRTEQIRTFEVSELIHHWERSFQIDVSMEFRGVSAIAINECQQCCLNFFSPDVVAGSARLYSELDRFDWYYMPKKWEYDVALRELKKDDRLLEVGCGSGAFLRNARNDIGLHGEGIDLNVDVIAAAQREGIRVRGGTVEEFARELPGQYDVVCSFQVLEHVTRPGEFLNACCTLLKPGGRLLLGLPNANSFLQYEFNLLDLPPHHMSRWSLEVLSRLSQVFPLTLQSVAYEPLPDSRTDAYVSSYAPRVLGGLLGPLCRPVVLQRIAAAIRASGVNRWMRGQTVYARFVREA